MNPTNEVDGTISHIEANHEDSNNHTKHDPEIDNKQMNYGPEVNTLDTSGLDLNDSVDRYVKKDYDMEEEGEEEGGTEEEEEEGETPYGGGGSNGGDDDDDKDNKDENEEGEDEDEEDDEENDNEKEEEDEDEEVTQDHSKFSVDVEDLSYDSELFETSLMLQIRTGLQQVGCDFSSEEVSKCESYAKLVNDEGKLVEVTTADKRCSTRMSSKRNSSRISSKRMSRINPTKMASELEQVMFRLTENFKDTSRILQVTIYI